MISRFMVAALCVLGPLTAGAAMQGFLGHAVGRIVTALGSGQSPPNVGQESGSSPCSNIVAIAGAPVNCSNLTPQQRKMIEAIPGLLKKMLTNQLDPAAVNAALDQIKKHMDEISKTLEKHDADQAERRETEEKR